MALALNNLTKVDMPLTETFLFLVFQKEMMKTLFIFSLSKTRKIYNEIFITCQYILTYNYETMLGVLTQGYGKINQTSRILQQGKSKPSPPFLPALYLATTFSQRFPPWFIAFKNGNEIIFRFPSLHFDNSHNLDLKNNDM